MGFKGFELVELETTSEVASISLQMCLVVLPTNAPHFALKPRDSISTAAEDSSGLAQGHLGCYQVEQAKPKIRPPIAVSKTKRLARKLPKADCADESWDLAAVTFSAVIAFSLILKIALRLRWA